MSAMHTPTSLDGGITVRKPTCPPAPGPDAPHPPGRETNNPFGRDGEPSAMADDATDDADDVQEPTDAGAPDADEGAGEDGGEGEEKSFRERVEEIRERRE